MLYMTRSIKNIFAPINRTPPEVLSLIPDYWDVGGGLIKLTHVCRSWREIFTSRASLWTFLNCTSLSKTRAYIQRSRESPLEISLAVRNYTCYHNTAFLLTLPHIGRLKALTLYGPSDNILNLTRHFDSPAPLLEKLEIHVCDIRIAVAENTLFSGNLSSLRELRLSGVLTNLPWQNLMNLTTFDLRRVSAGKISVTRLLGFFEHAPLLREIKLKDSLPNTSDAPVERLLPLPHLRLLGTSSLSENPTLLNHLHIPTGAVVALEFKFLDEISDYLPEPLDNLCNISRITSINLGFGSGMAMRLKGPSGGLYVIGTWMAVGYVSPTLGFDTLQSLDRFCISTTERLAITRYRAGACMEDEVSGVFQIFFPMNNLRTLTLTECNNLPFILALDPNHNTSDMVICPKLEELVLYVQERDDPCIDELLAMAERRASDGAKLSTVVIIHPRELAPEEKMLDLRSHVSRVEWRLDDTTPRWDILPGETDKDCYDVGW